MASRIVFPHHPEGSECHRIVAQVDPADIFYLTTLAETYEGLAIPRSVDQAAGIVEFLASPDYADDARRMIEGLGKEIKIRILRA